MFLSKFFSGLAKSVFSVNNVKKAFTFMLIVFFVYVIFLMFSPLLPVGLQSAICRISGFFVIVIMILLLALFFYSVKLIENFILRLGMIGCVGTIIMYSLWLMIDYGSKYPYASATGFNIPEITLGLSCCYLLLDKVISNKK